MSRKEWTYTREQVQTMLIGVGIASYLAGQKTNICMKPSLVAEKYCWEHLLDEEDREELISKITF